MVGWLFVSMGWERAVIIMGWFDYACGNGALLWVWDGLIMIGVMWHYLRRVVIIVVVTWVVVIAIIIIFQNDNDSEE